MSAPDDVQRLAGERAEARGAKDFALADELRGKGATVETVSPSERPTAASSGAT